jgi:hypothetical membrane protein
VLGGAVLLGDDDALGLLDDGAGFHGPAHVLGQGRGDLVEAGVGDGDGCVPGEGAGQLDGVLVKGGGLGGVDVEGADDGFLQGEGYRQGGADPSGQGVAGEVGPAGLGGHVGDADGPGGLGDDQAGAVAVQVLGLVQVQGQLAGERDGVGTVDLTAADDAFPVCRGQAVPWWAVVSSGLSPVLLVGAWLAAGAVQPASYSPIRQTISALAGSTGTDRWIMTGALFLVGGGYIVTAVGLASVRAAARILLIVAGLSTIGIAASPEPASGPTSQHLAWTVLAAITIAIWPAFAARRPPARPLILGTCSSAAVTAVFAALLGWLLIEAQGGADLGLAERLTTAAQACWPFVVAVALRRTAHGARRQELPDEQPTG